MPPVAIGKQQEMFQEFVTVGFSAFKNYADFGDRMDDLTDDDIGLIMSVVAQNVARYVAYKRHAKRQSRE